jgi:hypothetical protein
MASKGNGAQAAVIVADKLESLKDKFILREQEDIEYFIEENPSVVDFALEACSELRKVFPTEPLFMQMYYEPAGEEYDKLLIKIGTSDGARIASEKLDQFDNSWWLNNLSNANGKLNILLEYQ